MHVTFASIVLNESQYILSNLQQHSAFCDEWIIVEGADRNYPKDRVSRDGLSTDGTAEIVRDYALADEFLNKPGEPKIKLIQHGWAENKSELRNRYAELITDGIVIVFDADEFLTRASMTMVLLEMQKWTASGCARIPHVHLWKDDQHIITGSYYDVAHHRVYAWEPGTRYLGNHNHPHGPDGVALHDKRLVRQDRNLLYETGRTVPKSTTTNLPVSHADPFFLHYGFCKDPANIRDKNAYYVNRGEDKTRAETTRVRAAWFDEATPLGCVVHRWVGPYPEVFQDGRELQG